MCVDTMSARAAPRPRPKSSRVIGYIHTSPAAAPLVETTFAATDSSDLERRRVVKSLQKIHAKKFERNIDEALRSEQFLHVFLSTMLRATDEALLALTSVYSQMAACASEFLVESDPERDDWHYQSQWRYRAVAQNPYARRVLLPHPFLPIVLEGTIKTVCEEDESGHAIPIQCRLTYDDFISGKLANPTPTDAKYIAGEFRSYGPERRFENARGVFVFRCERVHYRQGILHPSQDRPVSGPHSDKFYAVLGQQRPHYESFDILSSVMMTDRKESLVEHVSLLTHPVDAREEDLSSVRWGVDRTMDTYWEYDTLEQSALAKAFGRPDKEGNMPEWQVVDASSGRQPPVVLMSPDNTTVVPFPMYVMNAFEPKLGSFIRLSASRMAKHDASMFFTASKSIGYQRSIHAGREADNYLSNCPTGYTDSYINTREQFVSNVALVQKAIKQAERIGRLRQRAATGIDEPLGSAGKLRLFPRLYKNRAKMFMLDPYSLEPVDELFRPQPRATSGGASLGQTETQREEIEDRESIMRIDRQRAVYQNMMDFIHYFQRGDENFVKTD